MTAMLENDLNGAIRNEKRILMRKPLVKEPDQDYQKIVKWFLRRNCEDVNMFRSMSNSKLWYLMLGILQFPLSKNSEFN
jgi:hypothetical protein